MPVISKISEKKLTAIIEPSGDGFVVSCQELDLATQGKTEEAFNFGLIFGVPIRLIVI